MNQKSLLNITDPDAEVRSMRMNPQAFIQELSMIVHMVVLVVLFYLQKVSLLVIVLLFYLQLVLRMVISILLIVGCLHWLKGQPFQVVEKYGMK